MRRRIALVIGQLTRGGAEGQLTELAGRLDRRRFEPVVYCLSDAVQPYAEELAAAGVRVRVVSGSVAGRLKRLSRCFREDEIDLVHSWLFLANAAAGWVQLFAPRRALVTSARNRKTQGRVNRLLNLLAFRLSTTVVVNSRDVADFIVAKYHAPQARIRIVPNGIDTERFVPAVRTDLQAPLVVTVGRLVPQKNQELFLRAAAALRAGVPRARFVIAGAGPLRTELEGRARDLGIADAVTFLGERPDVARVLAGAALFWLTSRWEGMPNVVLEAMACGVPVLATDVGGARELIEEGSTGFVLRSGDAAGFVARSRQILADPEGWWQFSLAARARAESFSLGAMVNAMEAIYEEALS